MGLRIVVIGGVAAGTKAAARARRLDPSAHITVLEKGFCASYGACGFPYYLSGEVADLRSLSESPSGTLRDAGFFKKVKDIEVRLGCEALAIDRGAKTVRFLDKNTCEEGELPFDRLVIATGAKAIVPPIPGTKLFNVHFLKEFNDAESLKCATRDLEAEGKTSAVVVGAGLIGMEVAEALTNRGWQVTLVEYAPRVMSALEPEFSRQLETFARKKGLTVRTGARVEAILDDGEGKVRGVRVEGEEMECSLVLLATGVRPEVELARAAGLDIGVTGAICVDKYMRTSDPDIFAAGDCAQKRHVISGKPCWVPLGSTANREGRAAGTNLVKGAVDEVPGVAGALILRFFEHTVARMGLGEEEARSLGFDVVTSMSVGADRPHFMEGAKPVILKLVADRGSRRLLGVHGAGTGDVARRVDAAAAALTSGMTVDQVANLDLLYAPPYAPPMDPLAVAANTLRNKLDGLARTVSASDYRENPGGYRLLDVRSPEEWKTLPFPSSGNVPLGALRSRADGLERRESLLLLCKQGTRGYEGQRILDGLGFEGVSYLEGGVLGWPFEIDAD